MSRKTRTPLFGGPIVSPSAEAAVTAGRRAMGAIPTERARIDSAPATTAAASVSAATPGTSSSCGVDLFQDARRHAVSVFKALLAFYLLLCFLHVVDAVREAAWRVSWPARGVVMVVRLLVFGWGSG